MKIEELNKTDNYDLFCKWWEAWGWASIPFEFLPDDGVVVSYDGDKVCAAFLYKTDTPICWAENYISDPRADREIRDEALNLLIQALSEKAKDAGFVVMMSAIKHNILGRRLEKNGFQMADQNLTSYIKVL